MVFQDYALWPHMTVLKNIAFGRRLRKMPRREVRERVSSALELVNLATVVREVPRGHYKGVVLRLAGHDLRAFVGGDTALGSDVVRVSFARALVYCDGVLDRQSEPASAPATGAHAVREQR